MKEQHEAESRRPMADGLLVSFLGLLALLGTSTMFASLIAGIVGLASVADWARRILPLWMVGLFTSSAVIVFGWRRSRLTAMATSLRASVAAFTTLFVMAGVLATLAAIVLYLLLPGPSIGVRSPPVLLGAMVPLAALSFSVMGWIAGLLYFARLRDRQVLQAERLARQELTVSEAALQRRNRELEALNTIASTAGFAVDAGQLAATCIASLSSVLGMEVLTIYLWDQSAQELVLSAQQGTPTAFASKIGRLKIADTPIGSVTQIGQPVIIDDVATDPRGQQPLLCKVGISSIVSMPLEFRGQLLGVMNVASRRQHSFSKDEVRFISAMADSVALAIDNERTRQKLEQAAVRDTLTGLYNRAELLRRLRGEVKRAIQGGQPVSLLLLDIDDLEKVNERFGRHIGDQVLHRWAAQVSQMVREYDIVGRYGGDEFVVVMPLTAAKEACDSAVRMQSALAPAVSLPMALAKAVPNLSLSIGVAALPEHAIEPENLIECANRAMLFAKAKGGNRVQLWDETVDDFQE